MSHAPEELPHELGKAQPKGRRKSPCNGLAKYIQGVDAICELREPVHGSCENRTSWSVRWADGSAQCLLTAVHEDGDRKKDGKEAEHGRENVSERSQEGVLLALGTPAPRASLKSRERRWEREKFRRRRFERCRLSCLGTLSVGERHRGSTDSCAGSERKKRVCERV